MMYKQNITKLHVPIYYRFTAYAGPYLGEGHGWASARGWQNYKFKKI